MPPKHRITTRRSILTELNTSSRRAYAQALADQINRHPPMSRPKAPIEPPSFHTTGATPPGPAVTEAKHPGTPSAGVAPARIYLGNRAYQRALSELDASEWDAWWDWLAPKFDRLGDRLSPPLLYRCKGERFIPSEYSGEAEQAAAMRVLQAAWVEVLEEGGRIVLDSEPRGELVGTALVTA